MRWERK
jgi:hypothetical protein